MTPSEVLKANGRDLLSYFRRRAGDEASADLLAETYAIAWRRVALMPADGVDARRWLFGIAHHVLLNHARLWRRQTRLAERLRTVVASSPTAPAADDGLEVRDAIARLDPSLAEIVRLHHWEGFKLVEVAEILGRSASTVRGEYARAKGMLRDILGEPEPPEPRANPGQLATVKHAGP